MYDNFAFGGFPFLNPKSELLQAWAEPSHNSIAVLAHRCTRINTLGKLFEESDDGKAEFRRR